jgi:4-aminobutyrate aminotransferase/(S)-3-amino-2-methylpropionate transaminase
VRDADGNVYVDLIAGFSVAAAGHAHPKIVQAVQRQAALLPHALGDVHPSVPKIELLERLASLAPFDDARIILGLNGADALAAAMKTAVLATGKSGVLAFEGGYHGLMYGPLSLCGYAPSFREPFAAQLNPHVSFAPYPSEALEPALDALDEAWGPAVGAVIVEPALGRGGLRFPPEGFLRALADRCRERGALLVLDEIFTGFGRTGRLWALEHEGVEPDVVCAGKALGGGLPISACIAKADVMAAWGDPDGMAIHTATFAANPLACAASLASLGVIEDEGLVQRSEEVGARWLDGLRARLSGHPRVDDVRGRGLMIGVELDDGALTLALVAALLERGYITLPAGQGATVLQLTPPLTIDEALLSGATEVIHQCLEGLA